MLRVGGLVIFMPYCRVPERGAIRNAFTGFCRQFDEMRDLACLQTSDEG